MSAPDTVPVQAPTADVEAAVLADELAKLSPREIDEQIVLLMRQAAQARIESARANRPCVNELQREETAAAERAIRDRLAPRSAEYKRRQWSRYFIPTREKARVHVDRKCGAFKRHSVVSLLWQLSGLSSEQVLALLGPVFCSQCYPGNLGPRQGITPRQAEQLLDGL